MKTAAKARKTKSVGSKATKSTTAITHSSTTKKTAVTPDYSKMHKNIKEVEDPVSFQELKDFYQVK